MPSPIGTFFVVHISFPRSWVRRRQITEIKKATTLKISEIA